MKARLVRFHRWENGLTMGFATLEVCGVRLEAVMRRNGRTGEPFFGPLGYPDPRGPAWHIADRDLYQRLLEQMLEAFDPGAVDRVTRAERERLEARSTGYLQDLVAGAGEVLDERARQPRRGGKNRQHRHQGPLRSWRERMEDDGVGVDDIPF